MCDAVGPEVGVQDGIEVVGSASMAMRSVPWIACGLCRRASATGGRSAGPTANLTTREVPPPSACTRLAGGPHSGCSQLDLVALRDAAVIPVSRGIFADEHIVSRRVRRGGS